MKSDSWKMLSKQKIWLHDYDLVIINSSAGKDSLCAIFEVWQLARLQYYPISKIVISHQDLGEMEWEGTKELVQKQADFFGITKICYSKRVDKTGREETLLEYVERRGKWPSKMQRYCTSDFKRGPGARVITALGKNFNKCNFLHVFGFRKDESTDRAKKIPFEKNQKLSTKKRTVYDWLPIHDWTVMKIWQVIKKHKLPYHYAYDLGMSRLSCVFCFFCRKQELLIAGRANPKLLNDYVQVEKKTGHTFKQDLSLESIQREIMISEKK
jgi:3'-phosphoadenosine 5'-phosphosulfate sulfotransferase (PAPS reductase)/FAD synthetase